MKTLEFLSVKDIMRIANCGKSVALKLRKDVAEHFGISTKLVTYEHLKQYLKLE